MFPNNICQNSDILVVISVQKDNFGFYSNRKTQGHKHQLNNLYFKYQVCQMNFERLLIRKSRAHWWTNSGGMLTGRDNVSGTSMLTVKEFIPTFDK